MSNLLLENEISIFIECNTMIQDIIQTNKFRDSHGIYENKTMKKQKVDKLVNIYEKSKKLKSNVGRLNIYVKLFSLGEGILFKEYYEIFNDFYNIINDQCVFPEQVQAVINECYYFFMWCAGEQFFDYKKIVIDDGYEYYLFYNCEVKPHLQNKENELIQIYKDVCEKLVKIKERELFANKKLYDLYLLYYINPMKALEYKIKFIGGCEGYSHGECEDLLLLQEKQKHFPSKW